MKKTLTVINLLAPPSSGKSTTCAGLYYEMKKAGYKVETTGEFAKDKVYEGHLGCLEDQIYIFGKQQRRLNRLVGQVDYAICDSPLPLSILYNSSLSETFNRLVLEVFNEYNNVNYYLNRMFPYCNDGRVQTEEESDDLGIKLNEILLRYNIPHYKIDGDDFAPQYILKDLI